MVFRRLVNTIWAGGSSKNWGRRCEFFVLRLNENMFKMLMCCIINIYPNELLEFLSATLHNTDYLVNCQTK